MKKILPPIEQVVITHCNECRDCSFTDDPIRNRKNLSDGYYCYGRADGARFICDENTITEYEARKNAINDWQHGELDLSPCPLTPLRDPMKIPFWCPLEDVK